MVKSMTSFGRASSEDGQKYLFSIEMKSVNHRYLDINIRMPKNLLALEEELRKIISSKLNRGKVDVFINYKGYNQNDLKPKVNINLAKEYYNCLKELEMSLELKNDVSVLQISRFPEVITMLEEEESLEEILEVIKPLLLQSLEKMEAMRIVEGEKLKEDILLKLEEIKEYVSKVSEISDKIPQNYKKKLEDRIKELLHGVDIDESRLAMEVAILSDKSAVDEEIIRLGSHLNQMEITLNSEGTIGRKLDFIIQEMNRETNTIASKSSDMELTNIVINIKNLIEKIREQVQNIE